jgi:glycosyltransferase involved in cell wall biosynthesis
VIRGFDIARSSLASSEPAKAHVCNESFILAALNTEDMLAVAPSMHEHRPLATVVIVNYNYEKFVAAAIDSALEQTYKPLEVVVVDDGSTDGSRTIIEGYKDRVRTVLQTNGGQGAAYNAGWRAAHGEFVLFLDSDDVLTKDAIAKVVDAFKGNDAVKVQFYLAQVDRNLKPLGFLLPSYNFSPLPTRQQIANYGYYVSPPASGNAFRKSFLDDIMPIADEELYRHAPDGYTTGLAGLDGGVLSISETLGYYRVHGDNYGGESGIKSLEQLHHMFVRDIMREDSEHAFGDHFNFHFSADRSRFCPGHTKLRLLSRRIRPDVHPVKTDKVFALVLSGLASAIKFPHLKLTKRFSVAIGFILMGSLPRSMLHAYFNTIATPQKRNNAIPGSHSSIDHD